MCVKKPVRSATPVVRQLFALFDAHRLTDAAVMRRLKWERDTNYFRHWRAGRRDPSLRSLEAVADALGYELKLVKKEARSALSEGQ